MRNLMTINFASPQIRKEDGTPFYSFQGLAALDGKVYECEVLVNDDVPGFDLGKKIAAKYRACFDAKTPDAYPRGFALEAPFGWAINWDQEREDYESKRADGTTEMKEGRWIIKPIRSTEEGVASIKVVKMPPVTAAADPEAVALAAKYGF